MTDAQQGLELDSRAGRLVLATVVAGSAVASLTATVVNVALPTLASDLGAGSSGQKWVVNGYTLTLASFILIGGSLGDRFGRVRVYRVGVIWFAVASLLCAVAWNVESLVAFRLLQGVGGALLAPGSLAIIESSLRRQDRGRGVGAWSGMTGVAGAVGPLLGGVLVTVSWRWVFVINLPVAAAVLVLSRWVPETKDPHARQSPLDLPGAVLAAVMLATASYALIEGTEGGFSGFERAVALAAVASAVLLWWREHGRPHAMVPMDLFADRTFSVANGLTFAIYGGMGVMFFLLSIQLQVTLGWPPIAAGAALLPVTLILLVLSPRMGGLSSRIGPRWPLTIGPLVVALGMALTTRIGPGASLFTAVLPAVVVFGLGLSAIVAPVTTTALGSVADERAGAASGVNNAVARTGGLLAVAAVPGFVGLTGDALSTPALLDQGFAKAMWLSAAIVAAAGVAAFLLLADGPTIAADSETDAGGPDPSTAPPEPGGDGRAAVRHHPCPVDGTLSSATTLRDDETG